MVFVIHWHESAMDLHVFLILITAPLPLHPILTDVKWYLIAVLICISLIVMLSIFSCVCWPSVCLLWRNVCLGLLPKFLMGCLFFWDWAVWDAYKTLEAFMNLCHPWCPTNLCIVPILVYVLRKPALLTVVQTKTEMISFTFEGLSVYINIYVYYSFTGSGWVITKTKFERRK